jgi:type IV pilus assembly protein PilM
MIWNPFKINPQSFLGVDIGTFSIKIVEMSKAGKRKKLDNYGEIQAEALYEKPFRTFDKSILTVSTKEIAKSISAILSEAKIKTKKAYFSIPDYSTFFTTFSVPPMTEEELPNAVKYEARQHIPLPLSEVVLDWQKIEGGQDKTPFKILLVAVPNEVINQYQEIAQNSGLELVALEAEVFGLSRSLVKEERGVLALIDVGARSTTVSIINNQVLRISHSFDTSGNDLTNIVAKSLNLGYPEAEALKKKQGLFTQNGQSREALLPLIDLIVHEAKKIFQSYAQNEGQEVQRVILSGSSALLPGFVGYFSQETGKPTEIASPFSDTLYPPVLEETLKAIGPTYSIAAGEAMKGLE